LLDGLFAAGDIACVMSMLVLGWKPSGLVSSDCDAAACDASGGGFLKLKGWSVGVESRFAGRP